MVPGRCTVCVHPDRETMVGCGSRDDSSPKRRSSPIGGSIGGRMWSGSSARHRPLERSGPARAVAAGM